MATVTFKGTPIQTKGSLPAVGTKAPEFTLTKGSLEEVALSSFKGKKVILNIFPSLDTETCSKSVKTFNSSIANHPDTVVLCISMDLPFAQSRFCDAYGIEQVIPLSSFRHPEFGTVYGVQITEGPLSGLLSRAVLVLDTAGHVVYTEHVAEITHEPDYAQALKHL